MISRLHETSFRILRVNLEAVKTKAKMRKWGRKNHPSVLVKRKRSDPLQCVNVKPRCNYVFAINYF